MTAQRNRVMRHSIAGPACPGRPESDTLAMAWHDPIRNWYVGLTPAWRRELRIGGLWLASAWSRCLS